MDEAMTDSILLCHAAATWFMVGVITFVQVVHYPMFGQYDRDRFPTIMAEHQRRTTRVVIGPMIIELATGLWLLIDTTVIIAVAVGLLVPIWMLTIFVLVPLHESLANKGFTATNHAALIKWNRLRMIIWWLRAVCLLATHFPL
jgi:hypothetical protein